jgi:asparagine synthase (glutamine-hydrolysing)
VPARDAFVSLRPEELVVPSPAAIEARRDADGAPAVEGPHRADFGHRIEQTHGDDDGIYAGWAWDGKTLRAWVDRYGMWPLFYAGDDRHVLVSDSLTALVARLRERSLDHAAIEMFLRLGFFLGNDTPFVAIRAFPPGGALTWDGALNVTSRPVASAHSRLSFDQAVDGYIELFRQAVKRRRPDDGVASLPLSGGRDSRHIALELHASGCAVDEYVTASKSGDDSDIIGARRLAARFGRPHVVVASEGPTLAWEAKKNEITHFCADEHGWIAPVFAYLARRRSPSFDGIGGDVLSAGLFNTAHRSQLARKGKIESLASDVTREWSPSGDALHVLRSLLDLPFVHADDIGSRLTTTIAQFTEHPNPISAFFFWNRTRREIGLAPFGLGRASRLYAPFLDREVFHLLASLPPEFSLDGRLHDAALVRAHGELGSVRLSRAPGAWAWARDHVRRSRAAPIARAIVRPVRTPPSPRVGEALGILRAIYGAQLRQHLLNA